MSVTQAAFPKCAAWWLAPGFVVTVAVCGLAASAHAAPLELHVATDGSDEWTGAEAEPFATLERARDEIRSLKAKGGLPPDGVIVRLHGGIYYLAGTFELSEADSGSAAAPIIYQAENSDRAWLSGGVRVDASHLRPVTDPTVLARIGEEARDHVVQLEMATEGITDYLRELPDEFTYKAASHGHSGDSFKGDPLLLELFCNGDRMQLARWPNEGFAIYEKPVAGVRDFSGGKQDEGAAIEYAGDRPSRWKVEDGVWLQGYWGRAYRCAILRVSRIDAAQRQIHFAVKPFYGTGPGGGKRFFALNLLEELDAPGEWYLDRRQGKLYFYPPAPLGTCEITVSMLRGPMVSMSDASFITLRGLGLECSREDAVVIHGGQGNRLVGCEIRNVGGNAVDVIGGTDHGVIGCDIHHIGSRGVTLSGGDRQTLTPANHVALNNHIHHTSVNWRTHAGAITLRGVGCRAAHNLIHHEPHTAVWYWGNDHLVEYNEIYFALTETTEGGVLYSYNEWTFRGNLLRYNYIHHINDSIEGCMSDAVVLHLDGGVSGTTFSGNICYRVGQVVKHNGGPANIIENNMFIDAKQGVGTSSMEMDQWTYEPIKDGKIFRTRKSDGLRYDVMRVRNRESVPYTRPPYTKYPHLADLLTRDPIGAPWYCLIARNIFVGGKKFLNVRPELRRDDWVRIEDNWDEGDPGFVDLEQRDFRLRADAPVLKLGFKPIPLEKIGLYEDEARASWPVKAERPPRDWKPPWMHLRDQQEQLFAGRLPVFRVMRAWGKISIDGKVATQEWDPEVVGGAPVERHEPARLQWGTDGERVDYPSTAWMEVDDAHLYVAFVNEVDPAHGVTDGERWGADDAVEIALAVMENETVGHIMILRGYPNGHFTSSGDGGAPQRVVDRVAEGVEYAAKVAGAGIWTAEWRIPFSSLGIDPRAKSPRMLFNLSARKPASKIWAMWMNAPGAMTLDVRKGGLLWLSPFGNVAFSSYAPSTAVIDIDGMRDGVVLEAATGCEAYPARWVKPKGSYLRGSTGELRGDTWQDAELSFVPAKDGVVFVRIRGLPFASAADNELIPVWTYFDDVSVEGAEATNGGFEEMGGEGLPEGWAYYTPSHTQILPQVIAGEDSAYAGRRCVKVWYSGGLSCSLRVEAGKQITVRAKVKGEVAQ